MRCNDLPLGLFENKLEKKQSNIGASKRIPCDGVLNSSDDDDDVEDIVTYHPSIVKLGRGGGLDEDRDNEIDVENYAERNEIDDQVEIENGIKSQDENDVLESSDKSTFLAFDSKEEEH